MCALCGYLVLKITVGSSIFVFMRYELIMFLKVPAKGLLRLISPILQGTVPSGPLS